MSLTLKRDYNIIMKLVIIILLLITCIAALWGYNIGAITAAQPSGTIVPNAYYESSCDDIIQERDGTIVCEVNMTSPTQPMRIFKGAIK